MAGSRRDWEGPAEAYAEAWLRNLALHVAVYLERLGNRDPEVRRVMWPIAERFRERLEEGMPGGGPGSRIGPREPGWSPSKIPIRVDYPA